MLTTFGVNVKQLRVKAGLTQKQLAERINVGKTTINNIETGYLTAPAPKIVTALANVFAASCEGILGTKPLDVRERARLVFVVDAIDAKRPFVELDRVVDSVFIDRDKLRGYEWFALRIKDNAMVNRRIFSGDTVVVKMGAPVKNNDIVVAAVKDNSEAIVRTYFKRGSIVTLKAENDSGMYKSIEIDTEKEKLKLIGKVEKCEFKP